MRISLNVSIASLTASSFCSPLPPLRLADFLYKNMHLTSNKFEICKFQSNIFYFLEMKNYKYDAAGPEVFKRLMCSRCTTSVCSCCNFCSSSAFSFCLQNKYKKNVTYKIYIQHFFVSA